MVLEIFQAINSFHLYT
uniref:Uncharacterized protein n=1 Tax=Rhizophora mucronata TaxID=61149 RepID=A0A2P2P4U8_RHIMU